MQAKVHKKDIKLAKFLPKGQYKKVPHLENIITARSNESLEPRKSRSKSRSRTRGQSDILGISRISKRKVAPLKEEIKESNLNIFNFKKDDQDELAGNIEISQLSQDILNQPQKPKSS